MPEHRSERTSQVATLEARIAELEAENIALQNEVVYRGVKLSCSKAALARATLAFDEASEAVRQAQASLVHEQRMAGIGQLAASVAHELNSPAGAVVSAQDTLQRSVARLRGLLDDGGLRRDGSALPGLLRVIEDSARVVEHGAQRMSETVQRLSAFTALDRAAQQRLDVSSCLEGTLALMARRIPAGVTLRRELTAVPQVQADARALNDVFTHLLCNALQAVGGSGTLRVATGMDDGRVCVTVEDTGAGMDAAKLQRLFDLDFMERSGRMGANMSLPFCARAVQKHGGEIRVASTPGVGTTFRVLLPPVREARVA